MDLYYKPHVLSGSPPHISGVITGQIDSSCLVSLVKLALLLCTIGEHEQRWDNLVVETSEPQGIFTKNVLLFIEPQNILFINSLIS